MIQIFRHNGKWRIRIVDETFEFKDVKSFEQELIKLTKLKEKFEPYKKEDDIYDTKRK